MTVNVPTREHWDGVWEKTTLERPLHNQLLSSIAEHISFSEATILEIGCGSAVDSIKMAQDGATVYATDYSLPALNHARQNRDRQKVEMELVAGDLFSLPYPSQSFDLIFSQGLLEHFTEVDKAVAEQMRVLKPGGLLCIDVPQTWSLYTLYKRWHMRRGTWFAGWETNFSLPELRGLMARQGLEIVSDYGYFYFPALFFGVRNLHTLNERYQLPAWLSDGMKQRVENGWKWLEDQSWYYRWLACIGVIGRKPAETHS